VPTLRATHPPAMDAGGVEQLLSKIVVGSNESVYGLNSAGNVFQYNVTSKTWTQLPGTLAQLAVAADGTLWGLSSSGEIWYYTP